MRREKSKESKSSSRFPYHYLVTTSPKLGPLGSPAILKIVMHFSAKNPSSHSCQFNLISPPWAWRAVCTKPRYLFTVACWSTITNDSCFMLSSCREQFELRMFFKNGSGSHLCFSLVLIHCNTSVALSIEAMTTWQFSPINLHTHRAEVPT